MPEKIIPILYNHDNSKPIGFLEIQDGNLMFKFSPSIKRRDFFNVFGNCAIQIARHQMILSKTDDPHDDDFISGQIVEWSLPAYNMTTEWKPIKTAPLDREILIMTFNGVPLIVKWCADCSMNEQEETVGQWQAAGDVYPACWTDGACWSSNAEETASDHPVMWTEKPDHPALLSSILKKKSSKR